MAGMDFSLRRHNRGMSVFWMILIVGAAVFLLLALILITSEREDQLLDEVLAASDAEPTAIVAESPDNPGTTSFSRGETADVAPTEEVELPLGPPNPDAEPVEGGVSTMAGDEIQPQEGDIEEEIPPAAEQDETEDVVVDPDDLQEPVVPTPSGPEARDDEVILEDEPAAVEEEFTE